MHSKWILSFVFLIVVGLSIECVNITIAYKYETENDVTSSLQVFQSDPRTNLLRTVRDDGIASTAAPSQNKFRLEASDKRVRVCTSSGQVRVDVRQFINERPTIKVYI